MNVIQFTVGQSHTQASVKYDSTECVIICKLSSSNELFQVVFGELLCSAFLSTDALCVSAQAIAMAGDILWVCYLGLYIYLSVPHLNLLIINVIMSGIPYRQI